MIVFSRNAIDLLSTVQLTRFAMKDIVDIASGEGGIDDILSLLVTIVLLNIRVQQQLQRNIALQNTLNATAALNPLTTTQTIIAGAIVGGAIIGGLAYMSSSAQRRERELRRQAYRRATGQ